MTLAEYLMERLVDLHWGDVSLRVYRNPFSFTVYWRGVEAIARQSGEADALRGWRPIAFDPRVERAGDGLILVDDGSRLKLRLAVGDGCIDVEWSSDEPATIIDTWASPLGGHWYGQGQLRIQKFPLNGHFNAMLPFLANNIQAPVWLVRTRSGVSSAIIINDYQLFETLFLNGLVVRALNVKSFSYRIVVAGDLKASHRRAVKSVGLPSRIPAEQVLAKPVYSTWAHYKKDIDEDKVLEYARLVKEHELPCSVIEVDDKWERNYGDFEFDADRFPDPKAMVDEIHSMGFLATLWVYPFINYESENYKYAGERGFLVRKPGGEEPAEVRWWDGRGGLLDISNPEARDWYDGLLTGLKRRYGIDGFKFDAGDGGFFPFSREGDAVRYGSTYGGLTPNKYTDEWLRFICERHYFLAEARVGYLGQRYGVIAREGDKESTWGLDNGLHACVTQALTLSMTGYPFIMPDMIGGNEYSGKCDKELFIRWIEATALMPVVQYSIPPWRFDEETVEIARAYSNLHLELADYFVELARRAASQGDPIVEPLVLRYPDDDKAPAVNDEYLVGDLLVAPVLERGRTERTVYLPYGSWVDLWGDFGMEVRGPTTVSVNAPLERLPLFANAKNARLRKLKVKIRG